MFNIIRIYPVFAGDIPESALHYADCCFIGTVQKVDTSITTIKISEVLFGEYSSDTVDIPDLKYSDSLYNTSSPKKGDYCAIVAVASPEGYKVYEGLAAKSDSLSRSKLKLKSNHEFIIRMNHYINSGHYSNDTINRIKSRLESREASTPTGITNTPVNTQPFVTAKATVGNITTTVKTDSSLSDKYLFIIVISCVLLAVVVFTVLRALKNNKK